jgi:hypothetical protein
MAAATLEEIQTALIQLLQRARLMMRSSEAAKR